MGNLTRDIQMRYSPAGTAVADFSMAMTRKAKDKEETCFLECTAFSSGAETLSKYLKKGDPLLVEGRLVLQQWNDKEGNKRSKISAIVESFQFLGSKKQAETETQAETQTEEEPF